MAAIAAVLAFATGCAAPASGDAGAPQRPAPPQPTAAGAAEGPPPAGLEVLEVATQRGAARFFVEIADDDRERAQGLMFRKSLAPDRGMLFNFHTPREVAFWMKNTLIPLDIIYIRSDGTILSIARNTTPYSEAPIPSGGAILGVLEIAGGRADELGILPGDKVSHRIFRGG